MCVLSISEGSEYWEREERDDGDGNVMGSVGVQYSTTIACRV